MRALGRAPYEPAAIYRYLVPREQQVLTLRQHWAFLIPPAAAAAGAALAAGVVTVVAPGAATLATVAWVLAGFLVARLIVAGLSWFVQFITITSERVVLTSGILNRKIKIIPLPNFAEMTFVRSFAGRMIGYGAFMVEATGKPYLIIDYIPYPEQVQLELTEIAFPKPAEADRGDDYHVSPSGRPSEPSGLPDYGGYAASTQASHQEPPRPDDWVHNDTLAAGESSPEEQPGDAPGVTDSGDPGRQADEE